MQSNPFPGPVTPDGMQRLGGSCSTSEYAYLRTGVLLCSYSVADIATVGLPLKLTLNYNHTDNFTGVLGVNWQHNYQMSLSIGMTTAVFTSTGGDQYGFILSGGVWIPDGDSYYLPATLTNPGGSFAPWRITFPNGCYFGFDSSGRLVVLSDKHGNWTTFQYDSQGRLSTVIEPTTRRLTLGYNNSLLVSVTDPNKNTTLFIYAGVYDNAHYDVDQYDYAKLTTVTGPQGCVTSYTWDTSIPSRITGRTDALGNGLTFAYNGSNFLITTVNVIIDQPYHPYLSFPMGGPVYAVEANSEFGDKQGKNQYNFPHTPLTDARTNQNGASPGGGSVSPWEYRFDPNGNLWRCIDPLGNMTHYRWDPNQNLIQTCRPLQNNSSNGPRDNFNNTFDRFSYDSIGNLLYRIDPTGVVTGYQYDSNRNLLSVYPGQAEIGVQGSWVGNYGSDGYLLCAFDLGIDGAPPRDRSSLPPYVSSVAPSGSGYSPQNYQPWPSSGAGISPMDPRAVMSPDTLQRSAAAWYGSSGTVQFTIAVNQSHKFNLSLYSGCADMATKSLAPMQYAEQFGRDMTFTVTDATGTQSFRMFSSAAGEWVTFPVSADATHAVTVTIQDNGGGTTDASVSAIAFDPYQSHRTSYAYNQTNDVVQVTDPLGQLTTIAYYGGSFYDQAHYDIDRFLPNGMPSQVRDPLGRVTFMTYGDDSNNLTLITDALGNQTQMSYDQNGNVLSVTNANSHTWQYSYDGQNRPLTVTDPLTHQTAMTYDAVGNLSTLQDANSNLTQFFYSNNRLIKVIDANNGTTLMTWDVAGNLTSVTNANGHKTTFYYDAANQLGITVRPDSQTMQVIGTNNGGTEIDVPSTITSLLSAGMLVSSPFLPLGTVITAVYSTSFNISNYLAPGSGTATLTIDTSWDQYQYDGLYRLIAVTSPNGTQPDATQMITTNGLNLFRNPGAETVDPNNSTLPQLWPTAGSSSNHYRDTTTSHSGTASMRSGTWYQYFMNPPPGSNIAHRFWYKSNNSFITSLRGTWAPTSNYTSNTPATTNDGTWRQAPWWRTTIPPVEDFVRTTLLWYQLDSADNNWVDDMEMYVMSTALEYDRAGRMLGVSQPDGGGWRVARDKFGRPVLVVDARGQATEIDYDALGRVVRVIDADHNPTMYFYDAVSNLTAFSDAKGNATDYGYDLLDRLLYILYPDATAENFSWDAASNLATYTNNRGQKRTFAYDTADRLASVTYNTDSTQVTFSYDANGNVLTRTERNGDQTTYVYDSLNRVTKEMREPAVGNNTPAWSHSHTWDAVGNRLAFSANAGARYNSSHYNRDDYGTQGLTWSIPGGYNAMELPKGYQDPYGKITTFGYDVESRLQSITFPMGVIHTVGYDIVGKVLSLSTNNGATNLLSAGYGYDPAGNRLGLVIGNDTFDYGIDNAGQLVEECTNRFVQRRFDHFASGTASNLFLDDTSGAMSLINFNDSFTGTNLNCDRWHLAYQIAPLQSGATNYPDYCGMEVRQSNGLHMAYPRGYVHAFYPLTGNTDSYGMRTDLTVWAAAAHRITLSGDFDVQVDFRDFQAQLGTGTGPQVQAGLYVSDALPDASPLNTGFVSIQQNGSGLSVNGTINFPITGTVTYGSTTVSSVSAPDIARLVVGQPISGQYINYGTTITTIGSTSFTMSIGAASSNSNETITVGGAVANLLTTDRLGTLRAVRSGATLTLYLKSGSGWTQVATYASFPTTAATVSLLQSNQGGSVGSITFNNFVLNSPATQYIPSGTYTSAVYDAGRTSGLTWNTLSWQASTPPGTLVKFQVATSSTPAPASWNFVGPDNTSGTYFIGSPATLTSLSNINPGSPNRYLRYQATLIGNGTVTPQLSRVDVQFAGTSASTLVSYDIDQPQSLYDYANLDQAAVDTINEAWFDSTSFYDIAHCDQDPYDLINTHGDGTALDVNALLGSLQSGNISRKTTENSSGITADVRDATTFAANQRINILHQILRQDVSGPGSPTVTLSYSWDASGNMTSKTPTFPITGDIASSSNTISNVSANDLARLYVGAPVAHADLPANTTVSTISSSSFTVNHNATGTQTAATITVTGQFFTGNLSNGSNSVTSVSQTDLAKLFVGAPLSSSNLPANTTVASVGSGSFTMNHNASGTASGAIIAIAGQGTTYSWDEDNRLTQVTLPGGITVSYQYDGMSRMLTRTHSVSGTSKFEWDGMDVVREYAPAATGSATYDSAHYDGSDAYGWSGVTNYNVVNGVLYGVDFDGATMAVIKSPQGHVRLLVDANGNVLFSANYDAYGNLLSFTDTTPGGMHYDYVGAYGVRRDADVGLLYMRQRFYNPLLQRFISRDPLRSVNRYTYVMNRPSTFMDPSGLCVVTVMYHPIGAGPLRFFYHAYIVVQEPGQYSSPFSEQDTGGSILSNLGTIYRAGPTYGEEGTQPGTLTGDFGPMSVTAGANYYGSVDYGQGGAQTPSSRVLNVPGDCKCIKDKLFRAAMDIQSRDYPYNPFGWNSNFFVKQVLLGAGLNPPTPPVWVPGWNTSPTLPLNSGTTTLVIPR